MHTFLFLTLYHFPDLAQLDHCSFHFYNPCNVFLPKQYIPLQAYRMGMLCSLYKRRVSHCKNRIGIVLDPSAKYLDALDSLLTVLLRRGPGGPLPFRIYVDSGAVFLCVVALAPACPLVAPAGMWCVFNKFFPRCLSSDIAHIDSISCK